MSRALQRPEADVEVGVEELRQPLRLRLRTLLDRAAGLGEGLDGHRQAPALELVAPHAHSVSSAEL